MFYWRYYNVLRVEEQKEKAIFSGLSIKEDEDGEVETPEDIARSLNDPLYKFPDDIKFLTREDISECSALSLTSWERHIASPFLSEYELDVIWNSERVSAATGEDIVAKRASQVDPLWFEYKKWRRDTGKCTLRRLRWFIERDIAKRNFYPVTGDGLARLREIHRKEQTENKPLTKISPDLPPPSWYLDSLRETGKWEEFSKQMDDVYKHDAELRGKGE